MAQSSRPTNKDLVRVTKAPWWRRFGYGTDETTIDDAFSNNYARNFASADGLSDVEVYRVDTDNAIRIGGEAINPMRATLNFPLATNASITTQCFFIAPAAMTITGISCVYSTADGAANTGYVTHETGTQAPGTGSKVQIGSFDLNTTTAVVQNASLPTKFYANGTQAVQPTVLTLAAGDRLSWKMASAVTSLAGLVITVYATPAAKGHVAIYNMAANGDLATQSFFLANRPMKIQKVQAVWSTKSSSATSTIDVTKDVSTNAPGAGTTVLAATVDATGTANTVATPGLAASAATLTMAAGDRLSVKFAGAGQVALAGVVVAVWFQPVYGRKEVTWTLNKTANIGTQYFFIADRDYEVIDLSEVHATANGAALKMGVTIDSGTTTAGSGLMTQTDNTNAGFDLNGTGNTVSVGTLATLRNRVLPAGARLAVKASTTNTNIAGVTITVSLKPC